MQNNLKNIFREYEYSTNNISISSLKTSIVLLKTQIQFCPV